MSTSLNLSSWPNLKLSPHANARNKSCATRELPPGSLVISADPLATVLFQSEKGRRCDACHGLRPNLQRCTGCASYWYCGLECQGRDWRAYHAKICKRFNKWSTSTSLQALAPHEQLDAILLTHLVARYHTDHAAATTSLDEEESSLLSIFMSLLPGPSIDSATPVICPMRLSSDSVSTLVIDALFSRFGNNNFAMHSHLKSYAHGIFPVTSRLFNHSCVPNAAVKYIIRHGEIVRMEVIALGQIATGDEICIPYVDPALLRTRRDMLELSYGFRCKCPSCIFLGRVTLHSRSPSDEPSFERAEAALRRFACSSDPFVLPTSSLSYEDIPPEMYPLLSESYLEHLSGKFIDAAHQGEYKLALDAGVMLHALYLLIYPPNYPQIGMHLLEMAKTSWNACITSSNDDGKMQEWKDRVRSYLTAAQKTLDVFGPEGDDEGPSLEMNTLRTLLE